MASVVVQQMIAGDEPTLIEMGNRMWSESERFKKHPLSIDKLMSLATTVHSNPSVKCFVAKIDGVAVGMWVGALQELWYSTDKVVMDLVFYIDKKHRGGSIALRLIRAAETWATSVGATENQVGLSSGIDTEKVVCFFKKMGYSHSATVISKEMK